MQAGYDFDIPSSEIKIRNTDLHLLNLFSLALSRGNMRISQWHDAKRNPLAE